MAFTGSVGTVYNRETWEQSFSIVDENGADVTITGATIVFTVTDPDDDETILLSADTTSGVTIATPVFTVRFEVASMRGLDPKTYNVGCTILLSGDTTQLIDGTVAVKHGHVA